MPRIKPEKRGQKKRKIKPVILIITEGSKTEPMYFDNYRTRQTNIDVRIVSNKADGAKPITRIFWIKLFHTKKKSKFLLNMVIVPG